jgi:hypothetical protein
MNIAALGAVTPSTRAMLLLTELSRRLIQLGVADGRIWCKSPRKAHPPVVIRALRRRHLSPLQLPLKGYPGFSGNLLLCNIFG